MPEQKIQNLVKLRGKWTGLIWGASFLDSQFFSVIMCYLFTNVRTQDETTELK